MCLLVLFGKYLISSDLQFGFQRRMWGMLFMTCYLLLIFFTEHWFTVNLSLLDLSKTFDKVNHYGLYIKLMKEICHRFVYVI